MLILSVKWAELSNACHLLDSAAVSGYNDSILL